MRCMRVSGKLNRRGCGFVAFTTLAFFALPLCGQDNSNPSMSIRRPVAFAISPPLRDVAKLPGQPAYRFDDADHDRSAIFHPGRKPAFVADPVEQNSPGAPASIAIGRNLLGIGNRFPGFSNPDAYPPDSSIAVGDTQVVEWVNTSYAVFDKNSGNLLIGPITSGHIWDGLGGECNVAQPDPIAQWDRTAHRWLLAQNTYGPFSACIAVSMTADATGSYYLYAFSLPDFPDYPKWGVWPSGYFQTMNMFNASLTQFLYTEVCAYNGAKMRVGDRNAEQICFQLTQNDYSLLPADQDSHVPPPDGQDEFFIGSYDVDGGNDHLYLYSMHPVFPDPAQSTFQGSNLADPFTVPAYNPYAPNCEPIRGACIPEPNRVGVGSLADRLMYRFVYWNDGPLANITSTAPLPAPAQHWFVNHTAAGSSGQAGVRWYEFTAPIRTVTISGLHLFQSGTFAPDSNYRWMASLARDKAGDIALGYSISSSIRNPAIAVTGRTLGDPLGQMEAEQVIVQGTGEQIDSQNRWGDYSTMWIDPSDGCTFWYAQEYYITTASWDWSTRLASLKFSNCH